MHRLKERIERVCCDDVTGAEPITHRRVNEVLSSFRIDKVTQADEVFLAAIVIDPNGLPIKRTANYVRYRAVQKLAKRCRQMILGREPSFMLT